MSNERYSRQKDIVPADRLADCKATVIGVGAIGRQVALQLTAMGAKNIQIVDHDEVEISNLASQGYWEDDLEKNKVDATGEACLKINKDLKLMKMPNKFRRNMHLHYFANKKSMAWQMHSAHKLTF